jgi:hypothetical protein
MAYVEMLKLFSLYFRQRLWQVPIILNIGDYFGEVDSPPIDENTYSLYLRL